MHRKSLGSKCSDRILALDHMKDNIKKKTTYAAEHIFKIINYILNSLWPTAF